MKHRTPTPQELKLWRESNRFTRKSKAEAKETEEIEAMCKAPLAQDASSRFHSASGTLQIPSRGKAIAPLAPLSIREASRLRKAYPAIEAVLDLHGLTKLDAYAEVQAFVVRQSRAGRRHVVIITGKGRTGAGVLRRELPFWFNEPPLRPLLSAFAPGKPQEGGPGLTHLWLKTLKSS